MAVTSSPADISRSKPCSQPFLISNIMGLQDSVEVQEEFKREPDQDGDHEQGTINIASVKEVLQSVKVCSVETLPKVVVADLFIRKAVRFTTKDDRKMLSVEVANGPTINFMVACLPQAV